MILIKAFMRTIAVIVGVLLIVGSFFGVIAAVGYLAGELGRAADDPAVTLLVFFGGLFFVAVFVLVLFFTWLFKDREADDVR